MIARRAQILRETEGVSLRMTRRPQPMNSQPLTFFLAVGILIIVWILLAVAKRRGRPFLESGSGGVEGWSPGQLLLASFLTLFAELAFIRWIAVEVRVFAYFKNLALLLCFVGFGLGCALAAQRARWKSALLAFLGLLLIVRMPWRGAQLLEGLSESLGGAGDIAIWATGNGQNWLQYGMAVLMAGALFLLIVSVFVPLGQTVSRQMDLAPGALRAYSWNLAGSLAGVVAFFAVSLLMLPPAVWLGAVLFGFAFLQGSRRDILLVASLVVPLVLLLHGEARPDTEVLWTPYQQIQYTPEHAADGEVYGGLMRVNHALYQKIVNLSDEFLVRHPRAMKEAPDENPYNLPFRFAVPDPAVMVVGSGTGNDVAAALRHGSSRVDAVEIDPAILGLGKRKHPEHPYDSPRVSIHVDDARAILKRTKQSYDLILFGLLDSHAQFSDYANMRIDNFVYTEESFREAARHLNPNGVIFVKFQVDHPWLATRLVEILRQTFGKSPLVFLAESNYSASATCFVISPGNRVEEALGADPRLAEFVHKNPFAVRAEAVPITTDDWPYLYQEGRWIPRTYYSIGVLVILIAIGLYSQIGGVRRNVPSLFFFSMGAGFLLLETQVISRLALFFGTVWQVNGIVISALLIALLLANTVVERSAKDWPRFWVWMALVAGLAIAYWFPFERIGGSPAVAGTIAVVVFSVPVVFAGILFALEFRATASPSAALGANILGAVAGGLLETLSLLFGMRALLLVAVGVYCLAGIGLWKQRRRALA
jgi:SAM-dependent methyltransferase